MPDPASELRTWTMTEIPDNVRRVNGRGRIYERRDGEPGWNRIDLGSVPVPVPYNDGELLIWCGPLTEVVEEEHHD